MRKLRFAACAGFLTIATGLAACGGGSSVLSPATPISKPTAAPTASPTVAGVIPTATPTVGGATPTASGSAPTSAPTSTPSAGAAPTPTPSGPATAAPTLAVSPSPLSFNATDYQQQFTVDDPSYTGTLTASSTDCSGIATFTPATAVGPKATFTVQSAGPGTCHINVADSSGKYGAETVVVTTLTGTVNVTRH